MKRDIMTGDNGTDLEQQKSSEPTKTPEQLKQERLDRYQKAPEKFIEISDIVACVMRSPQGLMVYIGGNKQELQIAYAELNEGIMNMLHRIRLEAAMRQEAAKNLIQKPGAMMEFARKITGRK